MKSNVLSAKNGQLESSNKTSSCSKDEQLTIKFEMSKKLQTLDICSHVSTKLRLVWQIVFLVVKRCHCALRAIHTNYMTSLKRINEDKSYKVILYYLHWLLLVLRIFVINSSVRSEIPKSISCSAHKSRASSNIIDIAKQLTTSLAGRQPDLRDVIFVSDATNWANWIKMVEWCSEVKSWMISVHKLHVDLGKKINAVLQNCRFEAAPFKQTRDHTRDLGKLKNKEKSTPQNYNMFCTLLHAANHFTDVRYEMSRILNTVTYHS